MKYLVPSNKSKKDRQDFYREDNIIETQAYSQVENTQNNFAGSVLFLDVGPRNQTQVVSLGSKQNHCVFRKGKSKLL